MPVCERKTEVVISVQILVGQKDRNHFCPNQQVHDKFYTAAGSIFLCWAQEKFMTKPKNLDYLFPQATSIVANESGKKKWGTKVPCILYIYIYKACAKIEWIIERGIVISVTSVWIHHSSTGITGYILAKLCTIHVYNVLLAADLRMRQNRRNTGTETL